jgi:hypothetical protein
MNGIWYGVELMNQVNRRAHSSLGGLNIFGEVTNLLAALLICAAAGEISLFSRA